MVVASVAAFAFFGVTAAAAQQPSAAPQLEIASAVPDASGQTLTIVGNHFGGRPLVTLELIPLGVQYASDTQIVAAAPVAAMPPGKYLLSVSRGPSAAENGSFQLTLGTPDAAKGVAAPPSKPLPLVADAGAPAARVGNDTMTVADLDREWQRTDPAGFINISREIYEHRRKAADTLVADALLAREAAARGLTVEALLAQEIPKRVVPLPDSAVLALYESLGDRARGAGFEQMRPALRAWLARNTEPELAKMSFVEELMKVSTRGDVLLSPPRVAVEHTPRDVVLGPATAPIELVVFGDLESPEYARFARAFGKVRETYADKVRIVFKHLAVLSPESIGTARAASCANAMGKFWPYHDAIVTSAARLDGSRLTRVAGEAGLERRAFDACLASDRFKTDIADARAEAERYGIGGSPSFLVNGWLPPPPPPFLPPFEYFTRIIEEELLRVGRSSAR
jgi:protein-disulfide isomerase